MEVVCRTVPISLLGVWFLAVSTLPPCNYSKVGAGGRMYAPVFYPSMQEIWPALYSTNNIRVVEVSVAGLGARLVSGESLFYQYVSSTFPARFFGV